MYDMQLVECNGLSEDISEQLEMLTQSKLKSSLVEPVVGEPAYHEKGKEEEEEEKWSEEDLLRIQPCVDLINVQ